MFGIPVWVFVLFVFLLYIGVKRCFTRIMQLKSLVLSPMIFIILGLKIASNTFSLDSSRLLFLLLGLIGGVYLGYLQVKDKVIIADKIKYLICIPGDISLLASLMVVFFVEYFIHHAISANWVIAQSEIFIFSVLFISGVIMGLTCGRNIVYLIRFYKSDHFDLTLPVER